MLARVFACALLLAVPAYADVAPPDSCSAAGAACTNAGGSANQPGVCTKTSCTRPNPAGGVQTYDCFRCFPSDAGASSSSSGGSSSGGKSGGCSATGARDAGPFALLALGALLVRKRRR